VTLQQNDVRNTGEKVVGRAADLAKFAEAALAFAEHPRSSSEARRLGTGRSEQRWRWNERGNY
jgi:hypothetical protein